jgi:hypothetical protein
MPNPLAEGYPLSAIRDSSFNPFDICFSYREVTFSIRITKTRHVTVEKDLPKMEALRNSN